MAGGCFSSQSFWKAGSARRESHAELSRKYAGVTGQKPGVCNNRARVEIGRLVSPQIALISATYASRVGPIIGSLALGKRIIERAVCFWAKSFSSIKALA